MKKRIFMALWAIVLSNALLVSKGLTQSVQKRPPSDNSRQTSFSHKPVEIELWHPKKNQQASGLIDHFEVIDARPDTSYIGVHTENLLVGGTRMKQIILKGSVSRSVTDYLNELLADPNSPYKILIVIRKLWVSDVTYTYREQEKRKEIYQKDDKINCRLRAEIYVSQGRQPVYTPLLRFDSLQTLNKTGYDLVGNSLVDLLGAMTDTLSTFDLRKKWETGRQLSLADIGNFDNLPFTFPIFRDTQLVKGVYANFDEFRNNAPSITDYDLEEEHKMSILYTRDASGTSSYNHKAWGVCDGKRLYVMIEGYLFPIFKAQNAFYLEGFVENKKNAEAFIDEGPVDAGADVNFTMGTSESAYACFGLALVRKKKESVKRLTRVFAIDPDTGAIY